ncbi:MAG: phytoene dehydrogenase-like protein [Verrucomicrobiales bacterium]|jgi:phytoene dehydrogenase-like protein
MTISLMRASTALNSCEMPAIRSTYDVAIIGSGHNGLVAACYLARAGLSVLVLESDDEIGGATRSKRVFDGVDAKLSVYSYLVSLFPDKIISDLGIDLQLRSRRTSSWTPAVKNGISRELLIRNGDSAGNRQAFQKLTGGDSDYRGYLKLQEMQEKLAEVVWPSLVEPLVTRKEMRGRLDAAGEAAWQSLIEEPLGNVIERLVSDDLIRGILFTDGRIGLSTYPDDPSLLQNRSFLYHVIGRGTGEWQVPVGGMGALVDELMRVANATGNVNFKTGAKVTGVNPDGDQSSLTFEVGEASHVIDASFILCNASAQVLEGLIGDPGAIAAAPIEGAGFKINMLLERLPKLRTDIAAEEAFAGTVHIDEGYEQMIDSYRDSMAGKVPEKPPGEIYCHTLTDKSILSDELNRRGFQTLTLFGLDMPYRLFENDNEGVRERVVEKYLAGINQFLEEPIESCLASDASGAPCVDAMSPVDLEEKIHLPKGNIFHGNLTWPFVEDDEEAGEWGVETKYKHVYLCGSAAKRGGAVSGIPGHNAAMKVIEMIGRRRL